MLVLEQDTDVSPISCVTIQVSEDCYAMVDSAPMQSLFPCAQIYVVTWQSVKVRALWHMDLLFRL